MASSCYVKLRFKLSVLALWFSMMNLVRNTPQKSFEPSMFAQIFSFPSGETNSSKIYVVRNTSKYLCWWISDPLLMAYPGGGEGLDPPSPHCSDKQVVVLPSWRFIAQSHPLLNYKTLQPLGLNVSARTSTMPSHSLWVHCHVHVVLLLTVNRVFVHNYAQHGTDNTCSV